MSELKHTPGPWRWYGSPKSGFYLATVHHGRRFVMTFDRLGMQGAQPTFQRNGVLVTGSELCRFEVAPEVVGMTEAKKQKKLVYRHDIIGFDSADATLIAAAPEMLEVLEAVYDELRRGYADATETGYFDGPSMPAKIWTMIDAVIREAKGADK